MNSFQTYDNEQRRRETDAAVKSAAIQQMANKPKRDVFANYKRLDGENREADCKRADAIEVVAQQTQSGKAAERKVVVGLPEQTGGLRTVSVDGSVVGHAQKVPEEDRGWGQDWAFKAVRADDLEYFESLAEIRAHAVSLVA